MKWFKVSLVLGIALLISVAAFSGTTDRVGGSMTFSRFLDVYAGGGWHSGNFTINSYSGTYFTVNDVLRTNFEVGGSWHIQAQVDYVREDWNVGLTPAAQKVLNAFEIGMYWCPYSWQWLDFGTLDVWANLLWSSSSVDQYASDPQLAFRWKISDLAGAALGGHTYGYAINFQLVSP